MLVIIPHPDDALKITKFQNALIGHLAQFNLTYYKKPPLWFSLPEIGDCPVDSCTNKEELKKIKISQVIMDQPFIKDGKIVTNISMQVNDQLVKSEFTLLYPVEQALGSKEDCRVKPDNDRLDCANLPGNKKILNFPNAFRIFRLGFAERLSETSAAVSDSVWRKL